MFQGPRHTKWALWFLALAVLCFAASRVPAIRRHLFWVHDEQPAAEPG